MRLLLLGSFHLGARLKEWGSEAETLRSHLAASWDDAVQRATAPEANFSAVILSGSLFDHPDPTPEVFRHAVSGLEQLANAGVPVIFVPGPHDGFLHPQSIYLRCGLPDGTTLLGPHQPRVVLSLDTGTLAVDLLGAEPPDAPSDDTALRIAVGTGSLHGERTPWAVPNLDSTHLDDATYALFVLGGGYHTRVAPVGNATVCALGAAVGTRRQEAGPRAWATATLTDRKVTVNLLERTDVPLLEPVVDLAELPVPTLSESGPLRSVEKAFRRALESRFPESNADASPVFQRALAHGTRVLRVSEGNHVA